jgi:hypothetical protein
MKPFIVLLAILTSLGTLSCSKSVSPQYPDYTEKDLQLILQKELSRQDVERLLGTPTIEMELDETSYMLRFQKPTQDNDLRGVNIFFAKGSPDSLDPMESGRTLILRNRTPENYLGGHHYAG